MKMYLSSVVALLMISTQALSQSNAGATTRPADEHVETIVCIRHGEKPPHGLGQLDCQGLNRALALPRVLIAKYGRPQFIFAPKPAGKVDGYPYYYYVRPLVTIEPTAIYCGLPVNTEFAYREIDRLESELKEPKYRDAVVFVAWEHGLLDDFARNMVKHFGGDENRVPRWPGNDYDSIFVFRIISHEGGRSMSFSIDHEGLNGLSKDYPKVLSDGAGAESRK